ncbi:hypothetical protein SEA_MELLIE_32 [Gordonia phage Mellie]|nr:hypothetical protein SEA_MELLIE_32 [Gordonia phage Mellie]
MHPGGRSPILGRMDAKTAKPDAPARTHAEDLCPECDHYREGRAPDVLANKIRRFFGRPIVGPRCNTVMENGDPEGVVDHCRCRHWSHAETITDRMWTDEG